MEITLEGYVDVKEGFTVNVAVDRLFLLLQERRCRPKALFLAPLTMEALKADLCPNSRHLSDIVGISVKGVPVLALANPTWEMEGKVWYR